MIKTTATEVRNNFGDYIERARREPVMIQRNGRGTVVLLDAAEYERLITLEQAASESARRPRRIGFAKGLISGSFDLDDDSHLEGFEEYMP